MRGRHKRPYKKYGESVLSNYERSAALARPDACSVRKTADEESEVIKDQMRETKCYLCYGPNSHPKHLHKCNYSYAHLQNDFISKRERLYSIRENLKSKVMDFALPVLSDQLDFMHEPKNSDLKNMKIIFDSGSTSHVCSELFMFDYILDCKGELSMPDRHVLRYLGKGAIGYLKDVIWVPELDGIYISCSKFDDEGKTVIIKDGLLKVYDETGSFLCGGRKIDGLYHYDEDVRDETQSEEVQDLEFVGEINIRQGSALPKLSTSIGDMKEIDYLHHRWGHLSEQAIKEALRRGSVNGTLIDPEKVRTQTLSFCPDCLKGKMKEVPSRSSETDYSRKMPMEYVATDGKGPFSIETWNGRFRYFDLFAFRSSHWITVKFKRNKDQFYENFEDVLQEVYNLGYETHYMQTDDDALYRSQRCQELLEKYHLNKRTSVPYQHSSNGWIERQIQTIMEKARTIMLIYDCPLKFWKEAIETAVYLYNRTPLKSLDWKTPYEMIYKEKPDISNLVPFYSPGLVFLSKEERKHSLSSKALECRMLGYDNQSKNGYIVYIPELGTLKRAVNCRFIEEIDLEFEYDQDEKRDFSRFKSLDDSDELKISNWTDFFDEETEPYWHEEVNDIFTEIDDLQDPELEAKRETLMVLADEFELPEVPNSIAEALSGKDKEKWYKAIMDEIEQLNEYGVLIPCIPMRGENVAKMKIVLETKLDNDFSIRYKARLVICGYSQVYNLDFDITYSPTLGRDSLRIVLTYIIKHKLIYEFYDFKSAFTEGINDYRIVGVLPPELFPEGTEPQYVEAVRALYGEKQAAYIWYMRLKEILYISSPLRMFIT